MWVHKVIAYVTVAVSVLEYSIHKEAWHNNMEATEVHKQGTRSTVNPQGYSGGYSGGEFWLVLANVALLILLANSLKIRYLNFMLKGIMCILTEFLYTVTGIRIPLEAHSTQPRVDTDNNYSSTRPCSVSRKRKRTFQENQNQDDGDGNENPKRKRNSKFHPNRSVCLPCALWSQSGSDSRLKPFHPIENSRHAGIEALALSQYATFDRIHFSLASSDCVCQPCYKDFMRNKDNSENTVPRWSKIKYEVYTELNDHKHCIFCCGSVCECELVTQWGPENWHGNDSISVWKQYLSLNGKVDYAISDTINHVCRRHYRRIYELKNLRICSICTLNASSNWKLVCNVVDSPEKICDAFSMESGTVNYFDWICEHCCLSYANDQRLIDQLDSDKQSTSPIIAHRSKLIEQMLITLRNDGLIFTKDIMTEFRGILNELHIDVSNHSRLCKTLGQYINTVTQSHYASFTPTDTGNKLGKAIYDKDKFTTHSLVYIFNMKKEEWKGHKDLRQLIKNQTSKFPKSKTFDYTQLISNEGNIQLDSYFDEELVSVIDSITTHSNMHDYNKCSHLYQDLRSSRIKMVIALLCFTMNPYCCFYQTLVGLLCYAYGLRDKGFEMLNALGCSASIDHIRGHGSFWAKHRQAIKELDILKFWRVSIDNLNFNMKFAKSLPEGSTGAKKMLNLITGQVTHQSSNTSGQTNHPRSQRELLPSLKELVHTHISKVIHCNITSKPRDTICVNDFKTKTGSNENYYFELFLSVSYKCVANRLSLSPTEHKSTLIETINNFMPHWTPNKKDTIVYATIDEALSGSIVDIESYLLKLKRDLHIGEEGYPAQITIAGDQQTYALMKDLQRQHPEHYSWYIVLHGDWHMLKLLSEIIRDILWDGGLKQLSYECGHKKMPTQWQEIHMLLLALYEALLQKALVAFSSKCECELDTTNSNKFWTWVRSIDGASNEDETSRFWASTLLNLNTYIGYYVAVRSGNWLLRNACLRDTLPLLFAYNHNKYEELSTMAIMDALTLPDYLLQQFLRGGWTVSVKGRPYHNIALDEAHESVINLRLKTITSRPSHFRTVELSNFMSYLDKIVTGFEGLLFRNKQREPIQYRKRFVCQRTTKMISMLKDVALFNVSSTKKPLCNPLSNEKKTLDSSTVHDLLNIMKVGSDRMELFICQYILPLPTTGPRKRRKRNRKLATFTRKSSTKGESKKREQELNNIAKNAMEILQSHGITAQTCPYPLAISDIHGNLRSSQKSQFLTTLTQCVQFDQALSASCPLLSNAPQDLLVVIDLLYFIHMPPPPTVLTFNDYFTHLWQQTISKYAIRHRAVHVYLVIDKSDFLPPPRSLVHQSRANKSDQDTRPDPVIEDDQIIPYNRTYTSLLSKSNSFKAKLLEYLSTKFLDQSTVVSSQYSFSVTIDSPSFPSLTTANNGAVTHSPANEHGEADYAIWHHCIQTTSHNILVVSSDTDTWVYGLGLCELGLLEGKQIYIQRGNTDSFVNINHAVTLLSNHHRLSTISFPVLTLVAIYVLTGCDYVSSFYMCTKTKFLEAFIQHQAFVCPNGHLLKIESGEFQYIDEQAWVRLVTAVYYNKFKPFFRSKPISHTYNIICNHPDSSEAVRMLKGLNYSPDFKKAPLSIWHEFIRRVTYHIPKVTKQHEQKLLPSLQALILHSKRANYVLKLAISASLLTSPFLQCFDQFGWHKTDQDCVRITWDRDVNEEESDDSSSEEESAGESDSDSELSEVPNGEDIMDTDSDGAL